MFHDTILKILESKDKFQLQDEHNLGKFKVWCIRILHNNFINNYRASKRHGIDSYDKSPALLFTNEPLYFSADEELIAKELCEVILNVEKNEINRKIFFGYMNGTSYSALSEIFDLPEGTLKSRLFNTRKKIKQALLEGLNRTTKS